MQVPRGTYAARVFFNDQPTFGPDGGHIVETFFAISPESEPNFSEIDFENLPTADGSVKYFVDDLHIGTHANGYAPTAPLSINFNLCFETPYLR